MKKTIILILLIFVFSLSLSNRAFSTELSKQTYKVPEYVLVMNTSYSNMTAIGSQNLIVYLWKCMLPLGGSCPIETAGNVNATMTYPNSTTISFDFTNQGDGSYDYTFNFPVTGTYTLSVTGNSSYGTANGDSIITVSVTYQPPGGGGGGGGGGAAPVTLPVELPFISCITLDPSSMHLKLRQGDRRKELITIKNKCNRELSITMDVSKIMEFIEFQESGLLVSPTVDFNLGSKQQQVIQLLFNIPEEIEPDVYTGNIKFREVEGPSKIMAVVLEINSKEALFDITAEIPIGDQEIKPGETINVNFKIYNLGVIGTVQVVVDMYIKDMDDNIILEKQKTLLIETQASFIEEFRIPKDIAPGRYIVYGKATYDGKSAVASATFYVKRPGVFGLSNATILIIGMIVGALLVLYFIDLERKKIKRKRIERGYRKQLWQGIKSTIFGEKRL